MLRTRMLSSARLLRTSGQEQISCYHPAKLFAISIPSHTIRTGRSIHVCAPSRTNLKHSVKPNIFAQIMKKFKIIDLGKYRRKVNGYMLYENTVDKLDYMRFFTGNDVESIALNYFLDFKLPDTFNSWFVITELHVWMLMVRCMAEGSSGQDLRNSIVEAMWADVNVRKNKLEKANTIALKKQVDILSQQFNGAIIGYDEGIMSDDKILAGALWRRFFQCEGNNPEYVEKLVAYVRRQIHELEDIPSADLMTMKRIQWLDYRNP